MKNIMFILSNYHYSQSKVMNNERLYIKKLLYIAKSYILLSLFIVKNYVLDLRVWKQMISSKDTDKEQN